MEYREIIDYWYSKRIQKHWFSSTSELDNEIKKRFEAIWERALVGELDEWQKTPEGCLALIIVLDQFPLNMYRGEAKSFQTESKAIEVALLAINNDFNKQLDIDKLLFLYMPFMHSENLEQQDLSVQLYSESNLTDNVKFAKHHREIIKRFGRFPHRNKILERKSTLEEDVYLSSEDSFKG